MAMQSDAENGELDQRLHPIDGERRQLINLAYRLLGSLADAEDVVQETFLRWYALPPQRRSAIRSPGAWLTTVASRICLDLLGSARVRRERYVGEWIPEPLPDRGDRVGGRLDDIAADPADWVVLDESVDMALLVVLEALTPAERVAFVLHDVFRYPFADVADVLGRSPAACRQLAAAARRRTQAVTVPAMPPGRRADIVRSFKQAWLAGDVDALVGLLDPRATTVADGGGLASAVLDPIEGSDRIARVLVGLTRQAADLEIVERSVNGQPGLVLVHERAIVAVVAFEVVADRIRNIWAVRNPVKLRSWAGR